MPAYSMARRASSAVDDRMAVVGDGDAAGVLQLGDVGQLFALLPARDGADRVDPRQAGVGGLLQDQLGDAGVVVDRRACWACTPRR